MDDLNDRQEDFCRAYAGLIDPDYMGNAAQSYLIAYDTNNYNTAKVNSCKLLKKRNVRLRVQELLKDNISSDIADQELMYLMLQRKDNSSKIRAIKEFNKRRRDIENRTEVEFTFKDMMKKAKEAVDEK